MIWIQRIWCLNGACFFGWFVVLQLNDIDAWLWVVAYGMACLAHVIGLFRRSHGLLYVLSIISIGLYGAWSLGLLTQTTGRWWDGEIEREVGGLAITAIAFFILSLLSRPASRFD